MMDINGVSSFLTNRGSNGVSVANLVELVAVWLVVWPVRSRTYKLNYFNSHPIVASVYEEIK
jgi:hypothetical protein